MRNNLIFSLLLLAFSAAGQGAGGFFGLLAAGGEAAPTGALDLYTGATFAFSADALLYGSYTATDNIAGSVTNGVSAKFTLAVRRTSDNAVRSFTFSEVSDGTLTDWVGVGGRGTVRQAYDQSGRNNHATQADTSRQPLIVLGGTLIVEGGRASLEFDGVNDELNAPIRAQTYPLAVLTVQKWLRTNVSQIGLLVSEVPGGQIYVPWNNSTVTFRYNYSTSQNRDVAPTTARQTSTLFANSGGGSYRANAVQIGADLTGISLLTSAKDLTIGSFGFSAFAKIKTQCVLFWQSDQATNRTGIETAINNIYNVY